MAAPAAPTCRLRAAAAAAGAAALLMPLLLAGVAHGAEDGVASIYAWSGGWLAAIILVALYCLVLLLPEFDDWFERLFWMALGAAAGAMIMPLRLSWAATAGWLAGVLTALFLYRMVAVEVVMLIVRGVTRALRGRLVMKVGLFLSGGAALLVGGAITVAFANELMTYVREWVFRHHDVMPTLGAQAEMPIDAFMTFAGALALLFGWRVMAELFRPPDATRGGTASPAPRDEECPVCGRPFGTARVSRCGRCRREVHRRCLSAMTDAGGRICNECACGEPPEGTADDGKTEVCAVCGLGFRAGRGGPCARCGQRVHRACLSEETVESGGWLCLSCAGAGEPPEEDAGRPDEEAEAEEDAAPEEPACEEEDDEAGEAGEDADDASADEVEEQEEEQAAAEEDGNEDEDEDDQDHQDDTDAEDAENGEDEGEEEDEEVPYGRLRPADEILASDLNRLFAAANSMRGRRQVGYENSCRRLESLREELEAHPARMRAIVRRVLELSGGTFHWDP